ncbi:protein ALP1-like [Homarus americanus]|uniref:protein ALP1-like n=1 Tax=Homarus americanus TaxID=6706 RepID=UPI001C48C2AA|nr:protein ALP1-like [Homarus americanus]
MVVGVCVGCLFTCLASVLTMAGGGAVDINTSPPLCCLCVRGMSKEAACIAIILALETETSKKKRKRKLWMKEWHIKRPKFSHDALLKELVVSSKDYNNLLRMDDETFVELLEKVKPYIKKEDTILRDAIPASQRLSSTLRFLATGQSFEALKVTTTISAQSLGSIIMETCTAITTVLKNNIKMPRTEEEWRSVAKSFQRSWNFPHCIGAIDGKHVEITKPPGSGSYYYNYKHSFSVVLMAVVNADYEYMMVDVGTNGRVSDRSIFANTKFCKQLKEKTLHIPEPSTLPGSSDVVPYVFVGDDAFPLMVNLMKPYTHQNLCKEQDIYNYRVSRAHCVVENAFGILASRFRILLSTINLCPAKVSTIVLACCHLHNYLRQRNVALYLEDAIDIEDANTRQVREGSWRSDSRQPIPLAPTNVQNAPSSVKEIRDTYCNYFNNAGSLPW